MATLHDTAAGTNDATGTTLATTDALAVTAGDLIVVGCKHEGATTTISASDGTNSYSVANAELGHANGDLFGSVQYAIASATGTVNPSVVLGASRVFRKVKAFSFTPGAGNTWSLDASAAAQGTSGTPSAGTASATAAGASTAFFHLYGTRLMTAGAGWTIPAEFSSGDAQDAEYQLQSGAGSLTGNATMTSIEWVAQMAIFKEVASGGGGGSAFFVNILMRELIQRLLRGGLEKPRRRFWNIRPSGVLVPA